MKDFVRPHGSATHVQRADQISDDAAAAVARRASSPAPAMRDKARGAVAHESGRARAARWRDREPARLARLPPGWSPGRCQFIAGEPSAAEACKCGAPLAGRGPYCDRHRAACYLPMTEEQEGETETTATPEASRLAVGAPVRAVTPPTGRAGKPAGVK